MNTERASATRRRALIALMAAIAALTILSCAAGPSLNSSPRAIPVESVAPKSPTAERAPFLNGVDASFLQQVEEHGGKYYENGVPKDALEIFKDHGINCVRLRVWHSPRSGYNDLAHTLAAARRVKALGLGLLLDLHYSDTWADPGHQAKPAAWAGLSSGDLEKAVHDYTKEVVTALKSQNTLPEIVQIGNEITSGILWNDGRVGGNYDGNWPRFAALLKAAAEGVADAGAHVAIMLHIDAGGNNATCRWFIDKIAEQKVPFDIVGLSYYPWWHGSLANLRENVNDLALRYGKQIVVVETAYPWTLAWYDGAHNLVGLKEQLLPGYPATVDGQLEFLKREKSIIESIPHSMGAGMFYWAPEYISAPGLESVWENVTLFDFQGRALKSLDAFSDVSARPAAR